jgi:hypothetical protein
VRCARNKKFQICYFCCFVIPGVRVGQDDFDGKITIGKFLSNLLSTAAAVFFVRYMYINIFFLTVVTLRLSTACACKADRGGRFFQEEENGGGGEGGDALHDSNRRGVAPYCRRNITATLLNIYSEDTRYICVRMCTSASPKYVSVP